MWKLSTFLPCDAFLTFVFAARSGQGSVADVSGNWSGKLVGDIGSAPFTMSLTQSGTSVTGTFAFVDSPEILISGTIANSLIKIGAQDASGSIQISGTVTGDTMSGTMTISVGEQTGTGNFTATH